MVLPRRRGLLCLCAALPPALALGGRTALASEAARATLRYDRASLSECPDETEFRREVMARLGYDPFVPEGASTNVEVRLLSAGNGLATELTMTRDARSTKKRRDASGETCGTLVESVARTVAMALDPIAASAPRPLPPLPPGPALPPVALAPPSAPKGQRDAAESAPTGASWTGYVEASGGAGLGELPGPALDGALAFELRTARWGVSVDGRGASTPGTFRTTFGDRVGSSLLVGGPGACVHAAPFSGCAHARFGVFRARAENVTMPADRDAFYAEAAVSGRLRFALGERGEFYFVAEAAAPLSPIALRVSRDEVWSASFIAARLGIGGSMRVF